MPERKPPRGRDRAKTRGQARNAAARRPPPGAGEAGIWLYGVHAVRAALANPRRRCLRLLATAEAGKRLAPAPQDGEKSQKPGNSTPAIETVARARIDQVLPAGAVHQGLALLAEPLPQPAIQELLAASHGPEGSGRRVVVVLDQVTDPQNAGAVLRSAARRSCEYVDLARYVNAKH